MRIKRVVLRESSEAATCSVCGHRGGPAHVPFRVDFWPEQGVAEYTRTEYRCCEHAMEFAPATLTVTEAAQWYGISEATIYSALRRGQLIARKSGATWLLSRAAMERYAAGHEPRPFSMEMVEEWGVCPFCGGELTDGHWDDGFCESSHVPQQYGYAAQCSNCGRVFSSRGLSREEINAA